MTFLLKTITYGMNNISECKKGLCLNLIILQIFYLYFVTQNIKSKAEQVKKTIKCHLQMIQIKGGIDFKNRCKKFNTTAFAFGNLNLILGNRTTHTSCSNKSTKTGLNVLSHGKEKKGYFRFLIFIITLYRQCYNLQAVFYFYLSFIVILKICKLK